LPDTSAVSHDPSTGRFEIQTAEGTALLTYLHHGSEIEVMHTEVPQALEGRGYGAALAEAALGYARLQCTNVRRSCAFVAAYIQRHPAYEDLVAR
jgi:predicted GNAT family acetyltransferase